MPIAHQPGSVPVEIPEQIPNPAVRPAAPPNPEPRPERKEPVKVPERALDTMRGLGGGRRHRADLPPEGQIGIARLVRLDHFWIAGQGRPDRELLRAPIDVRETMAGRRLDQTAEPGGRAENEFPAPRRVAARLR